MARTRPSTPRMSLQAQRRWATLGFGAVLLTLGYWWFVSDGVPVWWAPTASAAETAAGRDLFEHEWTPNDPLAGGDGLGPVFNAKSCVACHFQGGVGGGGEVGFNATHYEVLPTPNKNEYITGVLHNFSVNPADQESFKKLRSQYPIVKSPPPPPPPPGHCGYTPPKPPDVDPVRSTNVQTTALFGGGWLDKMSSKAITANHRNRSVSNSLAELKLDFNRVTVGRVRVLDDGRIGKFGWKAQFATLEEFVAAACANELGLGTPSVPQAKPLHKPTSPDVAPDMSRQQMRELMAFVSTLPRPVEVPSDAATHGKQVFHSVGCAACHVPEMGGISGVYSDFLLYRLDDPSTGGSNEYGPPPPESMGRPSGVPEPFEWKTPPLWGVADSAPYLHDGSAPTLADAIARHQGDAKPVSAAYQKLSGTDQQALLSFLESLKAPPDAIPAKVNTAKTRRLAKN